MRISVFTFALALAACGGGTTHAPAVAATSSAGSSSSANADTSSVELLCGRVSARLPDGSHTDSPRCTAAVGRVFGGERRFTVVDGDCHDDLVASEVTDEDRLPSEDPSTPQVQDGIMEALLADGTVLRVRSAAADASCATSVDHVLHAMAESLSPASPDGPLVLIQTSRGHRMVLDVPGTWRARDLGENDVADSAFEILPPSSVRGIGAVVTAWADDADQSAAAPAGARVALAPDAEPELGYHPVTQAHCLAYTGNAEPRLEVALLVCPGNADDDSEDEDDESAPPVDQDQAIAAVRGLVDEAAFVEQFQHAQFLPPPG